MTAPSPDTSAPVAEGPSGTVVRAAGLVRAAARDVLRLVLPVACAGCGAPDVAWCGACDAALQGPARRCDAAAGRLDLLDGGTLLPVWACADYAGPVRHAVGAWKDGGRADLAQVLRPSLHRAAVALGTNAPGWPAPVLVVPVPSTASARRRRGGDPVAGLAASVAAGLRDVGTPARVRGVLRRSGGPDLAALTARARGPALAGRVHVRRGTRVAGCGVVLVDDVLTTGATLAACHRALVAAGARVVGACALAATPAPDARGG